MSVAVEFIYNGKAYSGDLSQVAGAGETATWHLTVNKYYWGRMRRALGKWWFDPTPTFYVTEDLLKCFVAAVKESK